MSSYNPRRRALSEVDYEDAACSSGNTFRGCMRRRPLLWGESHAVSFQVRFVTEAGVSSFRERHRHLDERFHHWKAERGLCNRALPLFGVHGGPQRGQRQRFLAPPIQAARLDAGGGHTGTQRHRDTGT